jgi:hypothetical protein
MTLKSPKMAESAVRNHSNATIFTLMNNKAKINIVSIPAFFAKLLS